MKLYDCIIDDGHSIFKTVTAAKSKKALLDEYGGNGKFEKITDVTEEYFTEDSVEKLRDDLAKMRWGEGEINLICALLEEHVRNARK